MNAQERLFGTALQEGCKLVLHTRNSVYAVRVLAVEKYRVRGEITAETTSNRAPPGQKVQVMFMDFVEGKGADARFLPVAVFYDRRGNQLFETTLIKKAETFPPEPGRPAGPLDEDVASVGAASTTTSTGPFKPYKTVVVVAIAVAVLAAQYALASFLAGVNGGSIFGP